MVNTLKEDLYSKLKDAKSVSEAHITILNNMDNIKTNVNKTLINYEITPDFRVDLGKNYFPKKEYKGVTYEEGYYESLVVTLGRGEGNNFWCVLFPPLCLLEAEESNEVEYKFLVSELISKLLN